MKQEKIIIENTNFFIIQKSRPYFFPNCKNEDLINKTNLQYKLIPLDRIRPFPKNAKKIFSLNYYNIMKLLVKRKYDLNDFSKNTISFKSEFFKNYFLKKKWKNFYSCLIPQFFKKIYY